MAKILIVDDDDAFRDGLAETLRDLGHAVAEAGDVKNGLMATGGQDLIILDQRLPDGDAAQFLRMLAKAHAAHPPVVILTAFATSANTVEAMQLGAFDHLTKPIHRVDLIKVLEHALRATSPLKALDTSKTQPGGNDAIVGQAPIFRETLKLVGVAAKSDVTALLTGETGTGKELFAKLLHQASSRRTGPFIAVNCAAIPAELIESELFGHLKGAFSGATANRAGHFKSAQDGTLFLDEIGEMPMAMQAKILRVLEARTFTPVGGSAEVVSNARIIAATHRDLYELVKDGQFREDLFHRLSVLPIAIPSLRDRTDDIPLLTEHFLKIFGTPAKSLSEAAQAVMRGYRWPGNVRELRNMMSRLSITVRAPVIEADDVRPLLISDEPAAGLPTDLLSMPLPTALAFVERAKIVHALKDNGGNRAETARQLGIHRQLLYAKLKEHGLI